MKLQVGFCGLGPGGREVTRAETAEMNEAQTFGPEHSLGLRITLG